MMGLPVAFAAPWILLGLIALPVLWYLLRLVPPRPRRIAFPPTRLLLEIEPKEETPARTPWWLTALRLLLAALVIFAAAGPLLNPPAATSRASGPIVLLIDSGWAAAAQCADRARRIRKPSGRNPRHRQTGKGRVAVASAGSPRNAAAARSVTARTEPRR
jgi:hypothetical protein